MRTSKIVVPRYRFVMLSIIGLASLSSGLNNFTSGVILPLYAKELGMSPVQQGFLGASTWIVIGLLSIPFSCFLYWPKFSAKWLITLSGVTSSIAIFGQAFATTYEIILISRFAYAISAVIPLITLPAMRVMWFPEREYGTVGSIMAAFTTLGQFIGLGAAPFLMSLSGGWRGALATFGLIALIQTILWAILGKDRVTESLKLREAARPRGFPLRNALKRREIQLLALGLMGTPWIWQAFLVFYPTYLLLTYQIPLAIGGPVIAMLPVGSVIASLIAGPLSDRIGRRKPLIWPVGLVIPLFYFSMLQFRDPLLLSVLSFTTGFLAFIFVPPALTIPFDLEGISAAECGVATSFVTTVTTIGSVMGPFLAGYIFQSTGSLAAALAPMCISPATLLALFFIRETAPNNRSSQ